jgi:hypothetical protein
MKSIYVGNLPFSASEDEVRELFSAHGDVKEVRMISPRRMPPSRPSMAPKWAAVPCASTKRRIASPPVAEVARAAPGKRGSLIL